MSDETKATTGIFIGLLDSEGARICIGDWLSFDRREWGCLGERNHDPKACGCLFQIELKDGEIYGNGVPSDWPDHCTKVEP